MTNKTPMTNKTQTSSASTEQRQFVEHLEQASRIVQTWPIWKQTILGDIGGGEACQPQSSNSGGQTATGDAVGGSTQP